VVSFAPETKKTCKVHMKKLVRGLGGSFSRLKENHEVTQSLNQGFTQMYINLVSSENEEFETASKLENKLLHERFMVLSPRKVVEVGTY
jgi:glutamine synthetase